MQQHEICVIFDLFHLIRTDALKSLVLAEQIDIKPGDKLKLLELMYQDDELRPSGSYIEVYATTRNCQWEGLKEGYCLVSFNKYASPFQN